MIRFVRRRRLAVIGQGEWQFTEHHSCLMVTNVRWFSQMSDGAKRMHMKKVFSQKPSSDSLSSHSSVSSQSSVNDCPVLSVPVDECEITNVYDQQLRN